MHISPTPSNPSRTDGTTIFEDRISNLVQEVHGLDPVGSASNPELSVVDPMTSFDAIDRNGDGMIDRAEFEAYQSSIRRSQSRSPSTSPAYQAGLQAGIHDGMTTFPGDVPSPPLPGGGPNTLQERLHQFRVQRESAEQLATSAPTTPAWVAHNYAATTSPSTATTARLAQLKTYLGQAP